MNKEISIKYMAYHSHCMQENTTIIEIIRSINSSNSTTTLSPLNHPNSIENAQNPNLSKKTPSSHTTPKDNTQLKHGTQSSSKLAEPTPNQPAKENSNPTPSSPKSSTIIVGGNGTSMLCILIQHHPEKDRNYDSNSKLKLHLPTDIQRN